MQLRLLSELLPPDDQMSEVKEGGMLLLRVELTIALSILKRVVTRFATCERGNKVMFSLLYF